MTWGKIDDKLHSHPKVDKAGVHAMGLWGIALSYCCDQLTDGFVSAERVAKISGGKLPGAKLASALVKAKLWHVATDTCDHPLCPAMTPDEDGYRFHKWAKYQPTRAEVEANRVRKVEAGRKGGQRKAERLAGPLAPASAVLAPPLWQKSTPDPDPDPDPGSGSADPSRARIGPEPEARAPEGPPLDFVALVAALEREGNPFGVSTSAALAQGRHLTHGQRRALRRIAAERAAADIAGPTAPSTRGRPSSLQQPAAPGEPTWSIGKEI